MAALAAAALVVQQQAQVLEIHPQLRHHKEIMGEQVLIQETLQVVVVEVLVQQEQRGTEQTEVMEVMEQHLPSPVRRLLMPVEVAERLKLPVV